MSFNGNVAVGRVDSASPDVKTAGFRHQQHYKANQARHRKRLLTKTLLIMRLTAFILLVATLQVGARGYSQTVTINERNISLKQVFAAIEKQTSYTFIFNDQLIGKAGKVDVNVKNATVQNVLDYCLKGQPLLYSIIDNVVVIKKADDKSAGIIPGDPPTDVKGRVVNDKNEPVPGATIKIKETGALVIADNDGDFKITMTTAKATFVISSVGHETREVKFTGKSFLDVVLKQVVNELDQTVVIAYGTTTKRFNVGSVSKIKSEEITQQPVTNPLQALEGRVPGLVITQSSGLPGASLNIRIRGQNSLKPTTATGSVLFDNPLFIINGVPFAPQNGNVNQYGSLASPAGGATTGLGVQGLSPFNSINPSDIESIEVLRDADATAIYGSRGANGVILITTKRGKTGKATFDANIWTGESHVARSMEMMNTQQYLAMRREAFKNDGITPNTTVSSSGYAPDLLIFDTLKDVNWKKYFIGNAAHVTDANVSLSGGNPNTQFLIGAGYHRETYVSPGDFADNRASVNANINHNSADKRLLVDFSVNYSYDYNTSSSNTNAQKAFTLPPDYPDLLNPDGTLNWSYKGVSLTSNPMVYLKQPYFIKNYNLISHFQVDYQVFSGLTMRSSFGYNTFNGNEYTAIPKATMNPASAGLGSTHFGTNDIKSWIIEPQVEYKRQIIRGKLDILVGGTFQQNTNTSTDINGTNYPNDLLLGSISGAGAKTANGTFSLYKYNAVFGRLNYIWDNKYILNFNGRRDGSSRFGPGKQFGNFGSIGAGWLFSEESFIKNSLPVLSYGKIRTSYGNTGNDGIGDYKYLSLYAPVATLSYQGSVGYNPQNLYNPDFSWGVTKKLEVGLDLGFLKDRVLVGVTWFKNRSGNQLVAYSLPSQTGFSSVTQNAPYTVENAGFEIQFNSTNIKTKEFSWSSVFNLTIPKNTLVSFPGLAASSYANTYVIGKSLNVLNKFVSQGINDTTGVFQFTDINHDGKITAFTDFQVIGNLDPKFFGGLGNTFCYKGFQLDVFMQYTKQTGANYLQQIYSNNLGSLVNLPVSFLTRWQNTGDHTDIQKFYTSTSSAAYTAASNFYQSSGAYSDASFIRVKTVSISYNFPSRVYTKLKMAGCRLYVSAQNLITITNYKGNDPETQNFYSLPPLRTITAGIQFKF